MSLKEIPDRETPHLPTEPTLDAFRATLPGQILLGDTFPVWNLSAYALGIGAAAWLAVSPDRDRGRAALPA